MVQALEALAKEKGARMAQLAIAWVLYRGDNNIPLIGARNRQRLQESLSALDLTLSEEELARISGPCLPNGSQEHAMLKRKCPLWIANAAPGSSGLVGAAIELTQLLCYRVVATASDAWVLVTTRGLRIAGYRG